MEASIKQLLLDNAESLFGQKIDDKLIQFQKTRKDVEGDLTLVIFPFVKALRCSPVDAGEKIGSFLQERIPEIASYNVVSGFLNFVISGDYWLSQLEVMDASENYGFTEANSKPTVMVEYSSPNTNKPLHLGHLRNIFLGYSVAEILKANGHKVVKTQIINDRGIHICKSMLAWERFSPVNDKGERETPSNTGMKGDKLVGKYYVEFDRRSNEEVVEILAAWEQGDFSQVGDEAEEEVKRLMHSREGKEEDAVSGINDKIKGIAKNHTSLLRDAKEMLIKWEARDPQTYLLWNTMNGWVYKGFEKTYETMGVDFDKLYYESDTFLLGKDLTMDGLKKGLFYQKEDGSIWADLSDSKIDDKLLLRSDGTAVYMTQDVGTAVDRYKDFPDLDGMIYTVGNEQDHHFKVLFMILQKLGYSWADNCHHLSYGMVELPQGMGRMKSREGTVVDADDLMEKIIDMAREMTKERGHIDGMTAQEQEELFATIGLGGLKYFLLKVDPSKKLIFDPTNDEAIQLNGNTGPFIQYAHARIQSLLAKGGAVGDWNDAKLEAEEKEILKHLSAFPETLREAGKSYSPALLANYLYDLAKLYNTFFQNIPILIEEDANKRNMRLVMSRNVAKVIRLGMGLLGVSVPNKM